jgi:hypothetical protein
MGGSAPLPAEPAAFHFAHPSSPNHWDSILELVEQHPHVAFVGQNKPEPVGPERWAGYLSYRSEPQPTAADIHALLSQPDGPRYVMLEELHNAESEAFFVAIASDMKNDYPQWAGRWGAFVGFANYPLLADGIDALLLADAMLSLELYPSQSEYCASGSTIVERDLWLADQFSGTPNLGRLDWLMNRRDMHGSNSFVSALFGVGDVLLDGANPAIFLDRMFYVWRTRTSYPSLIFADNGGPGAYKWQKVEDTPQGYGVGNTSRDLAFAESFEHYAVQHSTSSRLGPVPCP